MYEPYNKYVAMIVILAEKPRMNYTKNYVHKELKTISLIILERVKMFEFL